jgi:glycosyltransferase involved in cell wall biosynthesis
VADSDINGFAAAVLRLMDEPALRARLGACAQQTVARDHSWDEVAARVEQVYARAVNP